MQLCTQNTLLAAKGGCKCTPLTPLNPPLNHVHKKWPCMLFSKRPQVDLAVKRRLNVYGCLYVFSMQNEVPIVSELPHFARDGGNFPLPHPPPGGPDHSSNPSYATGPTSPPGHVSWCWIPSESKGLAL